MDNFSQSQKDTIWGNKYGNSTSSIDPFGRTVTKNNVEYDHILPDSKGGATNVANGYPLNPLSNQEKSDLLSGTINGMSFQVRNNGNGVGTLIVNGIVK